MYYTVLSNGFTVSANALQAYNSIINLKERRTAMWTKPAATEMRFGFEVTMYVMNK
jgi:pyrroloquinoline quinone biosynthesis protein A